MVMTFLLRFILFPLTSFSVEDWRTIVHALKTYVISEEEALKKQNVGDREWEALNRQKDIIGHIELYVLPGER